MYEVSLLIDSDSEAAFTFKRNYPHVSFLVKDIRSLTAETIRAYCRNHTPDILIGGPPCQGFSSAGKRLLDDERNSLFRDFFRIVNDLKPLVVLLENVPTILGSLHGVYAEELLDQLEKAGYSAKAKTLQAADYGVPQLRRRAFFFALRKDLEIIPDFPGKAVSDHLSAEDAIGDLPPLKAGEGVDPIQYPAPASCEYQDERRKNSFLLFNHVARNHAKHFLEKIRIIPEGKGNRDLHPDDQFSDNYFSQAYARLKRKGPAYTITAHFLNPGSGRFLHYRDLRSITIREAARLQSFDDVFVFHGSTAAQERHIGNAVPPLLSLAWANHISRILRDINDMRK